MFGVKSVGRHNQRKPGRFKMKEEPLQEIVQRSERLYSEFLAARNQSGLPKALDAIELLGKIIEANGHLPSEVRGNIHGRLAQMWEGIELLPGQAARTRALENYRTALNCFAPETEIWAFTHFNIAKLVLGSPLGSAQAGIESAIAHLRSALTVFTIDGAPPIWAAATGTLGNAYSALPAGDRAANLDRAIACYQNALRVLTPDAFPNDCQIAMENLGRIFFDQASWRQALDCAKEGLRAIENTRLSGLTAEARKRIHQAGLRQTERGIAAAIRLGLDQEAIELADRSRTRNLADELWRREYRPYGVTADEWRQFEDWREKLQELEAKRLDTADAREIRAELSRVRKEIARLSVRFAEIDPDFSPLARPMDVQGMGQLAAELDAILVQIYVTFEGAFVFLVGPGNASISAQQIIHIPELSSSKLSQIASRWFQSYNWAHRRKHRAERRAELALQIWKRRAEETAQRLYEVLAAPVSSAVQAVYPNTSRLVLIPNKVLGALPLHAAWRLENGYRKSWLDDFEITYAPSAWVLSRCAIRRRANPRKPETLLAVQDPQENLSYSDFEIDGVKRWFTDHRILPGVAATVDSTVKAMSYGDEKVFSCHGSFDSRDPENSYLALSDGPLTALAIASLHMSGTKLVILSACETAITDVNDVMDEYIGLPAAFLTAGAETVIGTQWPADDLAAALLTRRFHQNMHESGMSVALALREAQQWLRDLTAGEILDFFRPTGVPATVAPASLPAEARRISPLTLKHKFESDAKPFAHPVFWAAFQCVGAP